uniref:SCAN box domain-containing protein n=1 Tax=Pipistrellus kuhlii TaxID=59472 RepID=A0A7J7YXG6_PIPKU|nr:hypothetical protein mPipKuh1_009939 [Pipistrellus kuhlii]
MMMVDLKVAEYLHPQIKALWETKGPVTESSSQGKKYTAQMDSSSPETFRQHFRNFHYHEAAGSRVAVGQLQELCRQWLRPDIHSKEEILDLLVLEQFLTILPKDTQTQIKKHHLQSIEEAVALVDHLQSESGQTKNGCLILPTIWTLLSPPPSTSPKPQVLVTWMGIISRLQSMCWERRQCSWEKQQRPQASN